MSLKRWVLYACVATLALGAMAFAACGGDDDDSSSGGSTSSGGNGTDEKFVADICKAGANFSDAVQKLLSDPTKLASEGDAAKALAGPMDDFANAFAKDRIRCNGIILGWTDTPGEEVIQRRFHGRDSSWVDEAAQHLPMGQLIHPDELAGLVTYLLSPESGVMTGALIEYDQFVTGARPE